MSTCYSIHLPTKLFICKGSSVALWFTCDADKWSLKNNKLLTLIKSVSVWNSHALVLFLVFCYCLHVLLYE
jgi:hypothetical protein